MTTPRQTIIDKAAATTGHTRATPMTSPAREVLSSSGGVAERAGFSRHAILTREALQN